MMYCVLQIGKECLSCRNAVAAFDMSYFGKYYLTGPDAQKAADWIFSNDVQKAEGKNSIRERSWKGTISSNSNFDFDK